MIQSLIRTLRIEKSKCLTRNCPRSRCKHNFLETCLRCIKRLLRRSHWRKRRKIRRNYFYNNRSLRLERRTRRLRNSWSTKPLNTMNCITKPKTSWSTVRIKINVKNSLEFLISLRRTRPLKWRPLNRRKNRKKKGRRWSLINFRCRLILDLVLYRAWRSIKMETLRTLLRNCMQWMSILKDSLRKSSAFSSIIRLERLRSFKDFRISFTSRKWSKLRLWRIRPTINTQSFTKSLFKSTTKCVRILERVKCSLNYRTQKVWKLEPIKSRCQTLHQFHWLCSSLRTRKPWSISSATTLLFRKDVTRF